MTDTAPGLFEIVPAPADIKDLPLPKNGPYLVLHQDGLAVHKSFFFGRALIPTKQAPMANKLSEDAFLWYDIPKLPPQIVGMAWSFFAMVFKTRDSEAMVDIMYDTTPERRAKRTASQGWDDRGYRLFVPPQRASAGGVEAKRNLAHVHPQARHVGTIHSHCDFDAFHSGTDTHDADGHDGLHITIGHVDDEQKVQFAVMISVGGYSWDFKLEDVTDGAVEKTPHPLWWHGFVDDPLPINQGKHISQWQGKTTSSWPFAGRAHTAPKTTKPSDTTSITQYGNRTTWFYDLEAMLDTLENQGIKTPDLSDAQAISHYIDEIEATLSAFGIVLDLRFKVTLPVTADRSWADDDDDDRLSQYLMGL